MELVVLRGESPRCISLVVSLGFLAILKSSFVIVTLCGWQSKKNKIKKSDGPHVVLRHNS